MTHKLVEPGYDARAAERVVTFTTRYAVRFDPVDRIPFCSGIVRRLAPIRRDLAAQICTNRFTVHKLRYRPAYIERERKAGYLNLDSLDLIERDPGRQALISLTVIHSLLNSGKTNYLSSGYCDNYRCKDKNPGKSTLFDQLISDTVSRC
jgi:hypothetical protein